MENLFTSPDAGGNQTVTQQQRNPSSTSKTILHPHVLGELPTSVTAAWTSCEVLRYPIFFFPPPLLQVGGKLNASLENWWRVHVHMRAFHHVQLLSHRAQEKVQNVCDNAYLMEAHNDTHTLPCSVVRIHTEALIPEKKASFCFTNQHRWCSQQVSAHRAAPSKFLNNITPWEHLVFIFFFFFYLLKKK